MNNPVPSWAEVIQKKDLEIEMLKTLITRLAQRNVEARTILLDEINRLRNQLAEAERTQHVEMGR